MLVLSRGPEDKIVFPNLDITIEILRVSGNRVRVGVEAPQHVRVLRHELADSFSAELQQADQSHAEQTLSHAFRNQLNTAHVALGLAEKQLNAGLDDKALATLRRAMAMFDKLDADANCEKERIRQEAATFPRALLVEDDANESELLAGFLKMSGFQVETATDGIQAMVQLGRMEKPDVVLLDMHMPKMNGPQTIRTIRDTPELDGIRVFAVSGADPSEVSVSVGPEGVDRWFRKPIKPQDLVDSMHEELGFASA
ncbi:MAG: response regulator [Planctomycetales bacterium]|nr:response regulator [Planctomycetales bacterium]